MIGVEHASDYVVKASVCRGPLSGVCPVGGGVALRQRAVDDARPGPAGGAAPLLTERRPGADEPRPGASEVRVSAAAAARGAWGGQELGHRHPPGEPDGEHQNEDDHHGHSETILRL